MLLLVEVQMISREWQETGDRSQPPLKDRARIYKRLWRPGIDSEDSIPPAYVAWRAGTTNIGLSYRPARLGIDSWAP
jgi:hypothetical protein